MKGGFIKASKGIKSWGNVVNYDKYLMGELDEQIKNNVVKTADNLYDSNQCSRDYFSESIQSYMDIYNKNPDVKAYSFVISYSPKDITENGLTPEKTHQMSMELCDKYFKNYPYKAVTHIDTQHYHTQVIVGNVNCDTGLSYRQNRYTLHRMKQDFAKILEKNNMQNSLTDMSDKSYNPEKGKRESIAEKKIKERTKGEYGDKGYTNKSVIGSALYDCCNNSKSFDELKSMLKEKYDITIKEKGKKHYVLSHPDVTFRSGAKKGQVMTMRENNLDEYSTTREEIEKKLRDNAEYAKKEYNKLSEAQQAAERDKIINQNMKIQGANTEVERLKNEFVAKENESIDNVRNINDNANKYNNSNDTTSKRLLLEQREKLLEYQRKIENEIRKLQEELKKASEEVKRVMQELKVKERNTNHTIITDDYSQNKREMPQLVSISGINRPEARDLQGIGDINYLEIARHELSAERERLNVIEATEQRTDRNVNAARGAEEQPKPERATSGTGAANEDTRSNNNTEFDDRNLSNASGSERHSIKSEESGTNSNKSKSNSEESGVGETQRKAARLRM